MCSWSSTSFQPASQPRDVPPNVPTVANTNSPARLVVPVLPDENVLLVPLAADCRSTVLAPDTSSAVTLLRGGGRECDGDLVVDGEAVGGDRGERHQPVTT